MKIIQAFGVPSSPLQVSDILTNLHVGHTLISGTMRAINTEKHLAKEQPAWPVVLPSIAAIPKNTCKMPNQILFVCDALALLSTCNIRLIKADAIYDSIRSALLYAAANPVEDWHLERREPSIQDYVSNATKPSFLNNLQTEIYRITPYDLRKQIQAQIIGYLAGVESRTKLLAKLASSHKLTKLAELVKDPKSVALHNAVAQYKRTQAIEATALETGFETFEILYISNSSRKTIDDAAKKAKKR